MKGPLENWEKMLVSPVAVFGGGVSGKGVCALLDRLGWGYQIFEDSGLALTQNKLKLCSVVVVSPGFRPDHPWLLLARKMKVKIFGELDFASHFCHSPITAITGTNGKTTVTTLLSHAFNKLGYRAKTAGNIGLSLSRLIADQLNFDTRIFLEVSSFQSRALSCLRAEQGIWTNFAEDHLDYHGSMEDYFQAKLSLMRRCSKQLFVGESVERWARRFSIELPSHSSVVSMSKSQSVYLQKNSFLNTRPQRENFSIAEAFAISLGISVKEFALACQDYKPQNYRLTKIDQIDKISFWNDSKATNFSAVIAACQSIEDPIYWIGGGKSKGMHMDEFAREIGQYIKKAFVIGEVGEDLAKKMNNFGTDSLQCFSLTEAVECAFNEAKGRVSILLSPGFASYDQFEDYNERGNVFNQSVLNLKKRFATTTEELLY